MVENSSERQTTSTEKYSKRESSTMLDDQAIELNFVRNRLETFQGTVLRDVQKRMSVMIDEVMQELRQHRMQANEFRNFATTQVLYNGNKSNTCSDPTTTATSQQSETVYEEEENKVLTKEKLSRDAVADVTETAEPTPTQTSFKKHALASKVFVMRESLLTALLEVDHMKTIYHIFYIIFLVFLLNNISYEYLVKGRISFGLATFQSGFENIHKVAVIWIVQHMFVFSIYFAVRVWSQVRMRINRHKTIQHLWSSSCLLIYISLQLIFGYLPTKICLLLNLPFVTASVLLLETVRLLMKMHSFVRTITPRVLAGKVKTEQESSQSVIFPAFNKYLYFLFAPTLLYRDEYPRNSTIRWKFAVNRLMEVVAIAFLYSYIYERYIKHHFGNVCLEELNSAIITVKLFSMLMPGCIIFLCGFYMILHAWLNFTAELLRFGDRMFYRDWWTVSNYSAYYRNWNVVVHDWLYEYIYKEVYNHIFKGSKSLSSITVFMLSALFHEYILGYSLQVVFPVMFFFFGVVGVAMIFVTRYTPKNLGNISLWYSLINGSSWVISLYSMEYFAQLNCPKDFKDWTDYLVPHVWQFK